LTSAFMRLSLYETIFGFTRLRTYSYIFIIWLGLLLIAVSILIWTRKIRLFTNLAIIASISFVATLNLLNPDAFITDQNISRAVGEELLDRAYLGSLSTDAIPALVEHFSSDNNKSSKTEIGTAILCFQTLHEEQLKTSSWQSFSISNWRAKELLIKTMPQLTDFEIKQEDWATIIVDKNGKETLCSDNLFFD